MSQQTIKQSDAAKRYGTSRFTLNRYAKDKKITAKRVGNVTYLLVKQLDELFGVTTNGKPN